jgi:hypothetical protein
MWLMWRSKHVKSAEWNYHFREFKNAMSRVLLEKLIVTQLLSKFPACFGTQKHITLFARARHISPL